MSTTIKSFFDRQKRDLSDKPNEEDERKKVLERERDRDRDRQREPFKYISKDDTDIFEE